MSSLFCGCACCDVDSDGTMLLPEAEAAAIGFEPGQELLFAPHEKDRCLIGYGEAELAAMRERAERWRRDEAGGDTPIYLRRSRRMFGVVERAPRGAGLRIPPAMRHLGRIASIAILVGAGERFEVWNPDLAAESDDPDFRALAAFRLRAHRRHHRAGIRRSRKGEA